MEERFQDYQNWEEADVIAAAQANDNDAIDYLMYKYKSLVRHKVRTLFLIGGDQDDLIQEGMIGLFKAIRDYRMDGEASFSTFADLCIARQTYSAIKSSNRLKNAPLNSYVSLYAPAHAVDDGESGGSFMIDMSIPASGQNPEEILINRENLEHVQSEIQLRFSDLEKQVYDFYMEGATYQEIATMMGREPKAIDNALQRIRAKVNQILADKNQSR